MSTGDRPFAGPQELALALDRAPVLIVGRVSGSSGKDVYLAAVDDLLGAAEFADTQGLDATRLLPPRPALVDMLRNAPSIRSSTVDGGQFRNRFVRLDFPGAGIHFLLSAGTGKKIDDNFQQPFVAYLQQALSQLRPALLLSRRLDRLARTMLGIAPALLVLEQTNGWVADTINGFRRATALNNVQIMLEAGMAEHQASVIPRATRDGMVRHTGTQMVNGSVPIAVGHVLPPGFTKVRVTSDHGRRGGAVMFLDGPTWHPSPSETSDRLPQVKVQSGDWACQVTNVQWALRHLFRPGWEPLAVAKELSRRGYSTDGYRRLHGQDSSFPEPTGANETARLLHSLLVNLPVYETGIVTLALGMDGYEPIQIGNCFPPSGRWADPEDFERIRRGLAAQEQEKVKRWTLSLTGVPATSDGASGRLVSGYARGTYDLAPNYMVRWRDAQGRRHNAARIRVPHHELAASLIDALETAAASGLIKKDLGAAGVQAPPGKDESEAEGVLRALEAEKDALMRRVTAVDDHGALLLSGPLLRELNSRYNELVGRLIPAAEAQLAETRVGALATRPAASCTGTEVDQLLRMAEALRDPYDRRFAHVWRSAVQGLHLTRESHRTPQGQLHVIRWSGTLSIRDMGADFVVAFSGSLEAGLPVRLPGLVDGAVDALRAGLPFHVSSKGHVEPIRTGVTQRWGLDKTPMVLSCRDGRIISVVARILDEPFRNSADIAEELGEPEDFVERLRIVHTEARASAWLRRRSPLARQLLELAACQAGVVRRSQAERLTTDPWPSVRLQQAKTEEWDARAGDDVLRLRECAWCGSNRRVAMFIPEPIGTVCLDCDRDRGGLLWPKADYAEWHDR